LEALSYRLPVLVSDILPHREFPLAEERYFPPGDITDLRMKIIRLLNDGISRSESDRYDKILIEKHNWDAAAQMTASVYSRLSLPSSVD
jgi:glycosyltransferase involved in cell wall biosynthesis